MTVEIIAKNNQQKSGEIGINTRTVLQPVTHYTCPVGKTAQVKGRVTCTGTGAGAFGHFLIAGVITNRWQNSVGASRTQNQTLDTYQFADDAFVDRVTTINTFMTFDVVLNAGETIQTNQDSGTNAEFNLFAKIMEFPA